MASMDNLFKKLREEKSPRTADEHWTQKKEEWLEDLELLMATLSGWLSAGEREGLLRVEKRTIDLDEEDLGTYEAPALSIHVEAKGPREVKIEPRGLRVKEVIRTPLFGIIGAQGRVDLACGPARAMLLRRKKGQWQFIAVDRAFSSGGTMDLAEDSFAEVLSELLE